MSGPYYAAARKRMYCHTRPGVNHVRPYIILLRQPIAIYNIICYIIYNLIHHTPGRGHPMAINTTAGLLDAIVLAVVGREGTGTYGYKITQEVRTVLDLSESTLYPVLRRLQKDGCLTVHDEAFNGRNRRYYQITPAGRARQAEFAAEWEAYTTKINKLFKGEQQ